MSNTAIATTQAPAFDLTPKDFNQALQLADYLADSTMVPKDFIGKPGNCLIAVQWGLEVGLKPLQALQNIAVINGRPSLWGDAMVALVRSSPLCEYIKESDDGKTATCKVKRRGQDEEFRTFSMDDAKSAGLLGKAGPWTQYPKRMRQMRARGFALRDVFSDVLKGMAMAEELMDFPKDMGTAEVVSPWSEQQLTDATEAANKGAKSYVAFWKALDKTTQDALVSTKEHSEFKEAAQRADASRTVDTPTPAAAPAQQPDAETGEIVTTVADVRTKLQAAKNEDALYVAMDWIDAVPNPEREQARAELEALFNTRLSALRGE